MKIDELESVVTPAFKRLHNVRGTNKCLEKWGDHPPFILGISQTIPGGLCTFLSFIVRRTPRTWGTVYP